MVRADLMDAVRVLVTDSAGVGSVAIVVNGKRVWPRGVSRRFGQDSVTITVPVRLQPGANTVVVSATNMTGGRSETRWTIERPPASPGLAAILPGGRCGVGRHPASTPAPAPRVVEPVPAAGGAPPWIQFSHPREGAKLIADRTVVIALVTDGVGIARLGLTVNGQRVPVVHLPQDPTTSVPVEVEVPLQIGDNVLTITAMNTRGETAQIVRVVHRAPPVAGAPAPPTRDPRGERYAVVIGVGIHDAPDIPRLRFAERDARAVYDFLTTRAQYRKDNVLLLTDTAQRPTLANIKRGLGEWLFRRAGRRDTVFVYYAGYGGVEPDESVEEHDGLSKYLLPRDADPTDFFVTAFGLDDIGTMVRRLAAERIVLVLDTCFGASGNDALARLSGPGRVILSGAGGSELARELPELQHGLFTYYLLQGMSGAAADPAGHVTVDALLKFVVPKVADHARKEGGKQTPAASGTMDDRPFFELAR
jgi:hypothetical protein